MDKHTDTPAGTAAGTQASAGPSGASPLQQPLGLAGVFGSTFFELVAYFMLLPMLMLALEGRGVSSATAGLFAATGWAGIFLVTPFASALAHAFGRRRCLWLSALTPTLATLGLAATDHLAVWFALELVAGMASGLRWVLAEAVVAELAPPAQRGRYVGMFETMVAATFVIGPMLLVAAGTEDLAALPWVTGLFASGLACSFLTPALIDARQTELPALGWRGLRQVLRLHPWLLLAGFCAGFFESGIASVLPLYGLQLGLDAAGSALLVSASGVGSALLSASAGVWVDRYAGRWALRSLMLGCCLVSLAATLAMPFAARTDALVWPIVFLWGGAGGALYTVAMIDIGSRDQGLALINATAVLVLAYTLGSMAASSASGALLQWAPTIGYPAALAAVALLGVVAFARPRADRVLCDHPRPS